MKMSLVSVKVRVHNGVLTKRLGKNGKVPRWKPQLTENKQTNKKTQVFISHFPKKEKKSIIMMISRTFRKTVVDTLYDHFVKVEFWLVLNCFGLWGQVLLLLQPLGQPRLHLERERLLVAFRGICCCCYNNDFAGFSFAHPHSSHTLYVMAPLLLWVAVLT